MSLLLFECENGKPQNILLHYLHVESILGNQIYAYANEHIIDENKYKTQTITPI